MTPSIKAAILKAYEFKIKDEGSFRYWADCNSGAALNPIDNFNEGRRYERAMFMPLITDLLQIIEKQEAALDTCAYKMNKPHFITHDELIQACGDGALIAFKALTETTEALKRLAGE